MRKLDPLGTEALRIIGMLSPDDSLVEELTQFFEKSLRGQLRQESPES
jgi:hypothetical protein